MSGIQFKSSVQQRPQVPAILKLYDPILMHQGTNALIYSVSDTQVIKIPIDDLGRDAVEQEQELYAHIPPCESIVRYFGPREISGLKGIVLEKMACNVGQFMHDARNFGHVPKSQSIVLKWAIQIGIGFAHLEIFGRSQPRMGLQSVLIDHEGDVKLADFAPLRAGQSSYSAWLRHPSEPYLDSITLRSWIFGFGTMMYTLETAKDPWDDLSSGEIKFNYFNYRFPRTDNLMLGSVIHRCWCGGFTTMNEVSQALQELKAQWMSNLELPKLSKAKGLFKAAQVQGSTSSNRLAWK
ncbi:hypothetical protein KEM56_006829 [Ascosphaera pollenicola]|nr:hypothetical protein KEM56_006829 [Ascosphaera pollenicola]